MNDIFISYSRYDSDVVNEIVALLEQEGYSVWIDRDGIESGEDFKEKIARAIKESSVVLFFSSEHSNVSDWTAKEIGIAVKYKKHIIPILLDNSSFNETVEFDLINLDFVDYSKASTRVLMREKLFKALRNRFSKECEEVNLLESKPKKAIWIAIGAVAIVALIVLLVWPRRSVHMDDGQDELIQVETAEQSICVSGSYNGHDFVDLGLPSGTLWATCNVGASIPEDGGSFFAWGETETKTTFNWSSYKYSKGDVDQLTKYCTNPNHGSHGFADSLLTLQPSDDAATVNWGDRWSIPTEMQWKELYQNTTNQWTERNGVKGRLFTSINGQSLFLPAAGFRWENELCSSGDVCYCWSSTLYADTLDNACSFGFNSEYYRLFGVFRSSGRSVRAVYIGIH